MSQSDPKSGTPSAATGGRSAFLLLPEAGVKGNSHMMMMDKNNLEVAGLIRKWIVDNAGN